ncbi:MAG TPA: GDSL-type esterase/lipase family protein [Cyclobacteriaceae bacterium]|nr:GDSL-type esterase/lipase family protein [Cyclobacteriaceae bacterium]
MRIILTPFVLLFLWACSPVNKYKNDPDVLQWEKDIRGFEQRDSTETDPKNAILFAGSSSIRLWSTIADDMKPYPVIQRGYGGAKFSDFAVYCKRIIYPHQFRALAIFLANDITGGDTDKKPGEVLKLFQYVVDQVRLKYKSEPIFFIQITPTNSRWKAWSEISKANDLIQSYCSKGKELYFIETADRFIGDNGKPKAELFNADQLHLNNDGYQIWSSIIKAKLDEVLAR